MLLWYCRFGWIKIIILGFYFNVFRVIVFNEYSWWNKFFKDWKWLLKLLLNLFIVVKFDEVKNLLGCFNFILLVFKRWCLFGFKSVDFFVFKFFILCCLKKWVKIFILFIFLVGLIIFFMMLLIVKFNDFVILKK